MVTVIILMIMINSTRAAKGLLPSRELKLSKIVHQCCIIGDKTLRPT